jgi:crotonobetainyl-CoA:carnitine CoA-transferase CaiB-like acyl-CoA transferase
VNPSEENSGMPCPLRGIIVVAVEQAVAAPLATRQLADLGARVVKIERPGVGDFARGYDRTVHGQSSYFVWLNRPAVRAVSGSCTTWSGRTRS